MSSTTEFKQKMIHSLLQEFFKDEKTKIDEEAITLMTQVMYIFVCEAAHRSAKEAKISYSEEVEVEHLEKILPQLLLDF